MGVPGEQISDGAGNRAVFWLETENGRIRGADYRATTCTTLVGVCEHLCDLMRDLDVAAVAALTCAQVLALHPEIPSSKHPSIALAVAALQSAARRALTVTTAAR